MNKRLHGPDFIICGAQKAGTTTLHHILDSHPQVKIISGEVNFWSQEDMKEKPICSPAFRNPYILRSASDYWSLFSTRSGGMLLGEDSTTYLSSEIAIDQIANKLPSIKLIILLRDPVRRSYSHYWHQVVAGRAYRDFATWIQIEPNILRRSLYGKHLKKYFDLFDRTQVKIILFEDFIRNKLEVLTDVYNFLNLGPLNNLEQLDAHKNRARVRRYRWLTLLHNHIQCKMFTNTATFQDISRVIRRSHDIVNPISTDEYPQMELETKRFLTEYFADDLTLLSTLVASQVDLRKWECFRNV